MEKLETNNELTVYLEVAMGEKTEKEQCRAVLYVIGLEEGPSRKLRSESTFNFCGKKMKRRKTLTKKSRKVARDSIFWPGINAQITDFISKCSVCLESRRSNTKELMTESETPELPWMTVESWGFTHTMSSPHYQQSNGLAERFVQSIKTLLSKSQQDRKDPYIAMLKYRNTPLENLDSPAQLLMNRRLRTTIPTIKNRLKPKCSNLKNTQRKMKQQKMNQNQYYDKSSKPLPELQPNDTIRFQHNPKGKMGPRKCYKK
ncbi:unnamed protein product [Mytilus coruscus]|uniref:Integrase catalytic domain-containing protein n=1 Tax=Mytilus coruscus TaxID=42192 RepID=A0A6J8A4U0_MYTCO|nr:unnamed protein product [Mytilus coruscus]